MSEKKSVYLKEIREHFHNNILSEAELIIGDPLQTVSNFQIIPVSKITSLQLQATGEFGASKKIEEDKEPPFASLHGDFCSLKPIGFLIDDGFCCRFINITKSETENILNKLYEVINIIIRSNSDM